jgi:hypothetical protein
MNQMLPLKSIIDPPIARTPPSRWARVAMGLFAHNVVRDPNIDFIQIALELLTHGHLRPLLHHDDRPYPRRDYPSSPQNHAHLPTHPPPLHPPRPHLHTHPPPPPPHPLLPTLPLPCRHPHPYPLLLPTLTRRCTATMGRDLPPRPHTHLPPLKTPAQETGNSRP